MAKKKELTSGQTSDQNIESINLDILPEVEEGYKPKVECNDLSEFFTPKDFAFMLIDFPKQFEEYKSRLDKNNYSSFGTPIHKYYKKFRLTDISGLNEDLITSSDTGKSSISCDCLYPR